MENSQMVSQKYDGEIVGSRLWLVDAGPVELQWNVLVTSESIDEEGLTGDYDISSRNNFKLSETSKNVLFGGPVGTIALELVTPVVDGINPSTRLTLQKV